MANRVNKPSRKELVYLYGISRGSAAVDLSGVHGVDGASTVEQLQAGDFTNWISRVGANEFGEELQRNMENLDWLAAVSVRHQRVVGAIYEKIQILPARFATLFSSPDALKQDVLSRREELNSALQRLHDADEWAVRIFSVPGKAPKSVTAASSGHDYLRQKSQQLKMHTRRALADEVKEFISGLNAISKEITQGGKFGATQPNLEWYASLLVPREKKKNMDAAISGFLAQYGGHYRIECSGPWPPYSFMKSAEESL